MPFISTWPTWPGFAGRSVPLIAQRSVAPAIVAVEGADAQLRRLLGTEERLDQQPLRHQALQQLAVAGGLVDVSPLARVQRASELLLAEDPGPHAASLTSSAPRIPLGASAQAITSCTISNSAVRIQVGRGARSAVEQPLIS